MDAFKLSWSLLDEQSYYEYIQWKVMVYNSIAIIGNSVDTECLIGEVLDWR